MTFKIETFPIVKSTNLLPITQQKISPGRRLGTGNEGMLMTKPGVRGRKTPVKNITNDRCVLPFREDCVLIVRPGPSLKKEIIKAPSYNFLQFRLTNTYRTCLCFRQLFANCLPTCCCVITYTNLSLPTRVDQH